ncbi:MAG: hypothetical protein Q9162_000861 [Coniocarpon cinnabarinum]
MEPSFNFDAHKFGGYLYLIQWVGGIPKPVSLKPPRLGETVAASDWKIDPTDIENSITPKTKFLMLNTPHNPLGKVFSESELRDVGRVCAKHNVFIISDEVYERVTYTSSFPRIASINVDLANITFTVLSVGKAFNATGWRLGFVIGPTALMGPVQVAHLFQTYVTAGPVQEAAAHAYEHAKASGFWEKNTVMLRRKVESFCEVLDEIGLPLTLRSQYVRPDAAFFLFVDVSTVEVPTRVTQMDEVRGKPHDYQVCWYLMQEFGIITIPGSGT